MRAVLLPRQRPDSERAFLRTRQKATAVGAYDRSARTGANVRSSDVR